jgi:hypothetical protein
MICERLVDYGADYSHALGSMSPASPHYPAMPGFHPDAGDDLARDEGPGRAEAPADHA